MDGPELPSDENSYPRAIGAVDADGDGVDEVFVKVYDHLYHSGASPVVGIFRMEGSRLVRVRARGQGPLEISVGGIVNFGEGLECSDMTGDGRPDLVTLRVDEATDDSPHWVKHVYAWRGTDVELVETLRGRLRVDGPTDPKIRRFYHLVCKELDPPPPY